MILAAAFAVAAHGQTASSTTAEPSNSVEATSSEQAVQMPAFTVETPQNDTSLTGTESTSTTRIAVDSFDLTMSVKSLNRALIDIVNPMNLSDMVNYVGGGQTGTLSWTSGRLIIRGFVSDGDYVDGFNPQTASNVDLFIYDRIEVIKGASAIFNTSSPPGGLVNKITKSPTEYSFANFGIEYGAFDAGKVMVDVGGPITKDKKLLFRVLGTLTDQHGYYDNTHFSRDLAGVMLTYKFSPETQLTMKEWYWNTFFPSYNPPPIDPNTLTYWPGLSYKRDTSEDAPANWRHELVYRTDFLFTTAMAPWASFRLAGQYGWETARRVESVATSWTGGNAAGITAQPGSGVFAVTGGGATFIYPYVRGVSVLPRATTAEQTYNPNRELQADYDFHFDVGPAKTNLLAGGGFVDGSSRRWAYTGTSSPIDIYTVAPPTVTVNLNVPTTLTNNLNQTYKIYARDTTNFFNDRLILDYGFTRAINTQDSFNDLTHAVATNQYYVYQNLRNYGILVKPLPPTAGFPNVAVFYNSSQAFGPNAPINNIPTPSAIDATRELGLRFKWLDDRLQGDVSYFQASASNQTVPSFPFTGSNVLIAGIISYGFDGDFTFNATKNFSILLTFADYSAYAPGQPANVAVIQPGLVGQPAYGVNGAGIAASSSNTLAHKVPVDDVAEQTWSVLARYMFDNSSALKGLDVAVGVDYQSKRAITDNANQIFFGYIPGRTLVNLFTNYKVGHITYGINLDNLFNTRYIYSARSVNVIEPGTPIDIKGTITYAY